MLVAIGIDTNDQLFPLAFTIVKDKNNYSWAWFMACILARVKEWLDTYVIYVRHRGIIVVMNDEYLGWASEGRISTTVCDTSLVTSILNSTTKP